MAFKEWMVKTFIPWAAKATAVYAGISWLEQSIDGIIWTAIIVAWICFIILMAVGPNPQLWEGRVEDGDVR